MLQATTLSKTEFLEGKVWSGAAPAGSVALGLFGGGQVAYLGTERGPAGVGVFVVVVGVLHILASRDS